MRKIIKMQNLDCANCAARVENAVASIAGVADVKVNFVSQKMILDVDDDSFNDVFEIVKKTVKKIDSDIEILE